MNRLDFVRIVVTMTLAIILCSMVFAMLRGLFDQSVDNKEIFTIIGPAFQTIVGCFVGYLGGLATGKDRDKG